MFIMAEEDKESARDLDLMRRMFPDVKFTREQDFPPPPANVHPTRVAFDVLAYSSLVIAGQSGFSRLAAVLTNSAAVVIDDIASEPDSAADDIGQRGTGTDAHSLTAVDGNIVRVPRNAVFWSTAGLEGQPLRMLLLELDKARRAGSSSVYLTASIRAALTKQGLASTHPDCFASL